MVPKPSRGVSHAAHVPSCFAVSGMRHAQDCHPVALKLNGSPLILYFQKKIIFSSKLFFLRRFRPAKADVSGNRPHSRSGGGSLGGCVLAPHSPASSRAPGARSTCAERSLAAACPVCEAVPREQTFQAVDFGLDLVDSAPRAETPTKTSGQKEGRRRNSREPLAAEGGGQADRPSLRGRARWPSLTVASRLRRALRAPAQAKFLRRGSYRKHPIQVPLSES